MITTLEFAEFARVLLEKDLRARGVRFTRSYTDCDDGNHYIVVVTNGIFGIPLCYNGVLVHPEHPHLQML